MSAYYNENDPYAAHWLRNLITAGHIAPGEVDERDIREVQPDDLRGFTQCHFFAGIAGWSHALRLAGWPDDRPVWTGSCPCQPFSTAGKGGGFADDRHLWPVWFRLVAECRPSVVFGEQVASPDGLVWLDSVRADLEGAEYAVGAADLCAASVGAPHVRQRLWFVADALDQRRDGLDSLLRPEESGRIATGVSEAAGRGQARGMAHPTDSRLGEGGPSCPHAREGARPTDGGGVEHSSGRGEAAAQQSRCLSGALDSGQTGWDSVEWLPCQDGKLRPTQPGLQPLAYGVPSRVGRLRAYGNAIVPQVAAKMIAAYMEIAR